MSRIENKIKIKEIRKYLEEKDYVMAQRILDTIDISKLRRRIDMSQVVDVYIENGRYEEALEVLYAMYERLVTRKILYQIIDVLIRLGEYNEAYGFLREYVDIAADDIYIYIFKYEIDKRTNKPYEDLIKTLEKIKSIEYMEKWAYELAKLYYKLDMIKECEDECKQIIIWFTDGIYAEKAKVLLEYFNNSEDKSIIIDNLKKKSKKKK